ncbi:AI-2E family transporter [Alkalibacterium kapii]|uniref:AI-2E family transporter n=1 Tax=Alkalibacterium kapii TaxID=426704 RepID=A0A511AV32_9LACT|nr:AI-2E family transporter [Alkalibacterium kapii]GEK92058.1 AI-2E family transporter [Alkalibacterium kapii]
MINWKDSKLMFWTIWLLAVAILIYVLQRIDFILNPLVGILTALFMPLLIAGFLYYLLNPIVKLLERFKVKRIIGIAIVMLLLIGFVAISILLGIPMLIEQTSNLISGIPVLIRELEKYASKLAEEPWMQQVDIELALVNLEEWLRNTGARFLSGVASGLGSVIQAFTDVAFLFITVPVILFYMLYDGHRFLPLVVEKTPTKYKQNIKEMILQTNVTISSYISGKGMASLIVGILLFIMYSIINLPSAFLLSFFAAITNFIPYVGPFIGAAPAIVVGLIESPALAVLAAVFVLIAQQLDSNFLTPLLVGKSLAIHPLTVILVLLASANIAGLVGMLIGVPVFAILKTIGTYLFKIYREQKLIKYPIEKNNFKE